MPVTGAPGTKAEFKQPVLATRAAFPDVRVDVKHIVAEGDFAVFHDVVHATSRGEFMGVPPNGKRLEWTEIHFLRITDGNCC
jgi:predicted ester cyclase